MTLPDYQSLQRPLLEVLADGKVWHVRDLRAQLATNLAIDSALLEERLGSGGRKWDGRVHWAATYLNQAGALDRVGRGLLQITDRGRHLLAETSGTITLRVLSQFEEFREFIHRSQQGSRNGEDAAEPSVPASDPQEQLASAVTAIEEAAAREVLDRIKAQDPEFLEHVIIDLMVAMGYGIAGQTQHLGGSGDEGFDGVIHQDALGLERVYLQAKRYAENAVGRPAVQAFAGALAGAKATRGVFITTSRFTAEAQDFADRLPSRVVLIDGPELGRLLVRYRVGVQVKETYAVVGLDEDYFEEA